MQIKIAKAKPYQINFTIARIKYPEARIDANGWITVSDGTTFLVPDYCNDWDKTMKLAKEKGLLIDCARTCEDNYRVAYRAGKNEEFTSVGKNLIRTVLRCYLMAELNSDFL